LLHARFEVAALCDEFAADSADRLAVVLAEVSNRLEIRHQLAGQPYEFEVALCLTLETAARLNPVEITVDIDLKEG
jgi:hypothetical protein